MTNKVILIDAAHREETRVAVLENDILQDFDRDAISITQNKGNIYLAKVIRVEQSLQSCFVNYGTDRHGFLPFADIHPDYYQISEAERQKLKELNNNRNQESVEKESDTQNQTTEEESIVSVPSSDIQDSSSDSVTATGSYSVEEETPSSIYSGNIHSIYKRYQIQDVIKPGITLLVQVTKEERGNKGASLTTYISIAGKYCVLMANTPNKGGVSKKVDNFRDRKILKSILSEINISNDRSIIIRTAGVGKKLEDIKRDCEYLNRLWDSIKDISASSEAPSFIHAEDDIIKRCIRDVYNEGVSEVVVEGAAAHEMVQKLIKLTMPGASHNIKLHEDRVPIFNKYRVEQKISSLYEKQISLPSGGSIVIDHTEALVAIDVNSGRATKENGVEEMAFNTNMEAVKEIARQLKLRDLAGLVVIDFIDMYEQKYRRNIEMALNDALENDRARIQIGKISSFGLLEMSRQRLGASFFETITDPCKHCHGTGYVRSVEILAVSILRAIRYACSEKQIGVIYIYTSPETISYMLNYKKHDIMNAEKNYSIHIFMHSSEDVGPQGFSIKKRRSLSDEERQEIEMNIQTGKVNQLGLENTYLDNISNNEASDDTSRNKRKNRDNYGKKPQGRKRVVKNYQKNNSIMGSIFSFLRGK